MGALDKVRIIELGEGLLVPYCGQLCGDAGAEVIKIEPIGGDWGRRLGPPFISGESPVFINLNRNKKGIALDLQKPASGDVIRRLAKSADVMIQGLEPGAAEALGVTYEALEKVNPKLIYLDITPFGDKGPYKNKPGTELTVQAMAEYTSSLGAIGEPPVRLGTDVANINTAVFGFQGILSAYFNRMRTGEGQKVSVSMFGSLMHMRGVMWTAQSNTIDDWFGFHCDSYTKPRDHGYQTQSLPVYFSLRRGDEEAYSRILIEFGMFDAMADPKFGDGGREATGTGRFAFQVKPQWEAGFTERTADEVCEVINKNEGEAVVMTDYEYLFAHPQVKAIDIVREVKDPKAGNVKVLRVPWKFSEIPEGKYDPPPSLGQHTDEVLKQAGYAAKDIAGLKSQQLVK